MGKIVQIFVALLWVALMPASIAHAADPDHDASHGTAPCSACQLADRLDDTPPPPLTPAEILRPAQDAAVEAFQTETLARPAHGAAPPGRSPPA